MLSTSIGSSSIRVGTSKADLFILLLVFAGLCGPSFQAGDAEILLQFQSELNVTISGWNISNANRLCENWAGVGCTSGRLTSLQLDRPAVPLLSGPFPAVLKNLSALEILHIANQNFWGVFPKEIFQLPNITRIILRRTPLTIEWPSAASASLQELNIVGTNTSTAIPDVFEWSSLRYIDVQETEVRCPIPSRLISRWSQASSPTLFATFTTLEITNNRLCDQIDIVNVPGAVTPVYGVKSTPNPALTFTAVYKNLQLEFYDHEIQIFGILKNGTVWRQDYFSLNIPPLVPWDRFRQMRPFAISPFKSVSWTIPAKQLTATATLTNSLHQVVETALVFDFDRNDSNMVLNGTSVKFSFTASNLNATLNVTSVIFQMVGGYHTQLSSPGDPPIYCGQFTGGSVVCGSPVANITHTLELSEMAITSSRIGVKNVRADISFSWGLNGKRDGLDLWASPKTEIDAVRYWHKMGHDDWTDRLHELGLASALPKFGPVEQQALYLIVSLHLPPFNQLIYDPDVSLSLLFDSASESATPNAPIAGASLEGTGVNIAMAVAIPIAVLTVGAGVFAFYWTQFRQQKKIKQDNAVALFNPEKK